MPYFTYSFSIPDQQLDSRQNINILMHDCQSKIDDQNFEQRNRRDPTPAYSAVAFDRDLAENIY